MKMLVDIMRWIRTNFFYLTYAIFISTFIWWFRLNPLVFGPGEEAREALIFEFVLLLGYGFIIFVLKKSKPRSFIKASFLVLAFFILIINTMFVRLLLPRIHSTARFKNTTYYITSNFPFLNCCGYFQFTQWEGLFHYESYFFGYNKPKLKFIHDEKLNEISLVNISEDPERLYMTLGEKNRFYEGYARLGNHLYYISTICNRKNGYCDNYTYTLYQCGLDNKSCARLPIEFVGDEDFVYLEANELTNEIHFYRDPYFDEPPELIFTYGKHPRCFVENCFFGGK